jgi:hypothetical protein
VASEKSKGCLDVVLGVQVKFMANSVSLNYNLEIKSRAETIYILAEKIELS